MEIVRRNPIYSVKNGKGELLNIRINDLDGNVLWNSHKEKRYWVGRDIYQAIAQAALINTKENEKAGVVEISEVQELINDQPIEVIGK